MNKANPGSRVAVLGASPKEDRYSFKAVRMLKEHGHIPVPVHPAEHIVDGDKCASSLTEVEQPIDTLTVYVSSKISDGELDNILSLKPRRVVFNPGAENSSLAEKLKSKEIETIEACTLVMLRSDQF